MTGIPTSPIALPVLPSSARVPRRIRLPAAVVVPLLLALLVAGAIAVAAAVGLSCFVVESPSMGRAAPVGTLVVSERVDPAVLRIGDVVTYRSPDGPGTVTHRIVDVVPGGFSTRGDLNGGADARTVAPSAIVGRAAVLLPGAGWLIRLAPWLAVGALSVWALTLPITSAALRAGARVVGSCAVVTSAVLVMRPLVGWTVLSRMPVEGGLMMSVVPTGLLPIRLAAGHGAGVVAAPGQAVQLLLPADTAGRVMMTASPALDPAGWVVVALLCLLPLIGTVAVGLPAQDDTA